MSEIVQVIPIWALWWVWMAAALILGIIEIVLPGFLFLGFAIGAALMALVLIVAPMALGLPLLLVIFTALSLVAWAVLRRIFSLKDGQVRRVRDDVNKG